MCEGRSQTIHGFSETEAWTGKEKEERRKKESRRFRISYDVNAYGIRHSFIHLDTRRELGGLGRPPIL